MGQFQGISGAWRTSFRRRHMFTMMLARNNAADPRESAASSMCLSVSFTNGIYLIAQLRIIAIVTVLAEQFRQVAEVDIAVAGEEIIRRLDIALRIARAGRNAVIAK